MHTIEQQTRGQRGLQLYIDRHSEFEMLDRGRVRVPGSHPGTSYPVTVSTDAVRCPCPDAHRHPELSCKHVIAAEFFLRRQDRRRK